jgi:phosphatidylinositol alpha-mannosyltransferase
MNIGLVSPYDYAYPGGVNTHISNLAMTMAGMGHRVNILAPCSNNSALPKEAHIIPLGRTIPYPSNGSVARLTLSFWLMSKIRGILERENFEILHFHEPLCPSLPWMVLRYSQSVNVGTFHAYYRRSAAYLLLEPMLTHFLDKLSGRIAVSTAAHKFVSRYFPGDYRIIPHGVDLERFGTKVPPIEQFNDGKLNILFVSRLEKRKGAKYLLQAYRKAKKECPPSRLIIVGPGDKAQHEYERWVRAVNLEDVIFTGHVPYTDLPRYYHTADIFSIPAIGQESFGIVLLEAMAAGKPIVATNIDGYASVVNSGAEGILVKPKDDQALASALVSLANDKNLREQMGAKGRAKAEAMSWPKIAQRTLDFYQECMKEKR